MAAVSVSQLTTASPLYNCTALACTSQSSSFRCAPSRLNSIAPNLRATFGVSSSGQNGPATRLTSSTVCKVSVGDIPPSFTLENENGSSVSLSKLKGKNVVVYFYPADDTPGCTKEACAFRDSYDDFKKLGATVIGISADSPESHKAFKAKYDLPFTLLTDEGNKVREEWGVPKDFLGLLAGRQTYVIDKKGVVQLIFNNQFQAEKHVDEALAQLESQATVKAGFWPF